MTEDLPFSALRYCRVKNKIVRQTFAEFIGTMVLIIMADSAAASQILKGGPFDGFAAAFSAGIGLFLGVLVAAAISGGHINPMVTLGLASVKKCPWKCVPFIIFAQHLGAFVGSALVYANNVKAIDEHLNHTFVNHTFVISGIFTTFPGDYTTAGGAVLDQTICAGILMFSIMALIDRKNLNVPPPLIPISVGLVLSGLAISFSLNCGAALNPARDFSGRLFSAIAFGSDVWSTPKFDGNYWWTAGLIGPHIGGIVGAWVYYLLIELHHERASVL